MSLYICLVLLLCGFSFSSALYEDQIGKFDWRLQFVGRPKFIHLDPAASSPQKFVVSTDKGVLASILSRNGEIEWRKVFENLPNGIIDSMTTSGQLATISGGGKTLRVWDHLKGVLAFEKPLFKFSSNYKRIIYGLDGISKTAAAVAFSNGKAEIFSTTFSNNANIKSQSISTDFVSNDSPCEIIGDRLICISSGKIHTLLVNSPTVGFMSKEIEGLTQTSQLIKLPYVTDVLQVGIKLDRDIVILSMTNKAVEISQRFPNAQFATTFQVENRILLGVTSIVGEVYKVKVFEKKNGNWLHLPELDGGITLPPEFGAIENLVICASPRPDKPLSYKLIAVTEDGALLMFFYNGKLFWAREEALAAVTSAQYFDLPLSDIEAEIEEEFQHSTDVLAMFIRRITSQAAQLKTSIQNLMENFLDETGAGKIALRKSRLVRDKFGFHKVIVLMTEARKLFVLDSSSGEILWSRMLREIGPIIQNGKPTTPIFVQRTTAHFPYGPICTILGKSVSGKYSLYSFDPITGRQIDFLQLPFKVVQAFPTMSLTEDFVRGVVLVNENLGVTVYPSNASKVLFSNPEPNYFYVVDPKSGTITGHIVKASEANDGKVVLSSDETWRINLPRSVHNILQVVSKNPFSHIHSMGRVMGDRSVLYKYLNPNLICIVTEEKSSAAGNSIHLFLIDGVTGHVIFSTTHKRAIGPVHVVHSENFVAYTMYSEKGRRYEISAIELYEGQSQANTTFFSSLTADKPKLVEHQTFIIPVNVECMHETETEKGITNKHVVVATSSGALIEIPKMFLDPRRPIQPTAEHREEGLMPYLPELKLDPQQQVNYNKTLERVRGMATAVTSLESTCLFIAYGLDIFSTRLAPSKHFDILKDDFDHVLICVVLSALFLSSYVTKYLAARKTLRAAWK